MQEELYLERIWWGGWPNPPLQILGIAMIPVQATTLVDFSLSMKELRKLGRRD
jgi:hypothetical protein